MLTNLFDILLLLLLCTLSRNLLRNGRILEYSPERLLGWHWGQPHFPNLFDKDLPESKLHPNSLSINVLSVERNEVIMNQQYQNHGVFEKSRRF